MPLSAPRMLVSALFLVPATTLAGGLAVAAPASAAPAPAPDAAGSNVEGERVAFAPAPARGRLSAGVAVAGRRGAHVIATTPAVTLTSDVSVIGASWSAASSSDAVLQYRVKDAGRWSAWQSSDSDPGIDEGSKKGARAGSDAIPLVGAEQVQARLVGSALLPKEARLSILRPKSTAGDAQAASQVAAGGVGRAARLSGVVQASVASLRPPLRTRPVWKANESGTASSGVMAAARGFSIHHTAGSNNYTQAQVPAILRGIHAFHTKDRGWSDIGYNYLVDKWGGVWEGRRGSDSWTPSRGAHTLHYNDRLVGISLLGDYNKVAAPAAAVERISRIVAWKSRQLGIDPTGTTVLAGRTMPTVVGHRDVGSTSCPGTYLYAKLPAIRERAESLIEGR